MPGRATHGAGEMPRHSREERARRCVLIRTLLELHTLTREAGIPHEEAIVSMAIRLGQYEGRPMDVTDLAEITGLPLSSVSRHVKALRKKGRVRSIKSGRRILQYLPLGHEPAEITRFYSGVYRVMLQGSIDISKMETSTIDKD